MLPRGAVWNGRYGVVASMLTGAAPLAGPEGSTPRATFIWTEVQFVAAAPAAVVNGTMGAYILVEGAPVTVVGVSAANAGMLGRLPVVALTPQYPKAHRL